MSIILSYLFSLAAPLVLLPIEQLFSYSYLLEEIVKLAIVFSLPNFFWASKYSVKSQVLHLLALGGLFTLSESVLYLMNFFILFDFSELGLRLVLTGALHMFTFLLFGLVGKKSPSKLLVTLIFAMCIHLVFNEILVTKLTL